MTEIEIMTMDLLTEVMDWHSDPDSTEYNECDIDPCAWCELAAAIVKGYRERG